MSPFTPIVIAIIAGSIVFSLARRSYFSLVMAAVIGAVFAIQIIETRAVLSPLVLDLAFQPVHLTRPENLYTTFTSMFLHGDFWHLIFNMIALILIGPLLEERIGTPRFALIYIASGLVGSLAFGLVNLNRIAIVLGASGAISGVLGAFAILFPREKLSMIYVFIPLPPIRVPYIVAIFILIQTFFALDPANLIAHEAHLGGLAAGILFAPLVMRVGSAPKEVPGVAGLEELAVNDELKAILEKIDGESVEEVRRAWLERFLQEAVCPECGGQLRSRGTSIRCDCGWSTKVKRKRLKSREP
jgi:membrane associated rhomboid family serine protease